MKRIVWTDPARADVRSLSKPIAMHILSSLHRFAESGAGDVKALQGREELRLRVGDYRLFFVFTAPDTIEVRRVHHRAPLSVAFAVGRGTIGVLPAMGGLMGAMSDTGGSYVNRVKRVTAAAVLGGAAGLAIGSVIHGHGWIAVLALVLVAGVSGAVSALGDIGSATGLQLLVYCGLGLGPLGAQRPVWHTIAGFVVGAAWALILILPGWLLSPHGQEQRDVAAVYTALAAELRSAPDGFAGRRQAVTGALSTAYDTLLRGRSTAAGRSREAMRLIALLNASHLMGEAAQALGVAGTPPPAAVVAARGGAGRRHQVRDPAAGDPAGLGRQPGRGRAGRRHGRRGAGAVQRLGAGATGPRTAARAGLGSAGSIRGSPGCWTGWSRRSAGGRSPGCSRCG